ncbi:putative membrane protein [Bacilli bacterium PM5-3]|nr:putative membrane protein [Bacilli bacterium PM5-3]
MKYQKKDIMTTITGFLMAIADSVPGVSGGTIAYILGKYEQFVSSIAAFGSSSTKQEKKDAIDFLLKFVVGWAIGMVLALSLIASLVGEKPYELVSLFLGFILVAIPFIFTQEKLQNKINLKHILFTMAGIVLVVVVTNFSSTAIDLSADTSILKYVYIFIVGAIAISAMILPGISGSTFLLIFGLYMPIVSAVKEVLKFNFSQLDIVLVFGFGVLLGLFYFSKLVKYLMKNHREIVVFFVMGLMIGSIYAIIMGPTSLSDDVTKESLNLAPLNFENIKLIWMLAGVGIIIALEKIKKIVEGGSKNE